MKELAEEEQLFEHYRYVVDKGQSILRIDKWLFNKLVNISRSKIQEAADAGNILVNDKEVKSNYKVKPSDIVTIVFDYPPKDIEIVAENIPLDILFEDEDIILINKKPGMVVHPSYGHYSGTMVNALAYHLINHPMFQYDDPRPGIVHRIDKNTSGVLLIAKTEKAKTVLSKNFFDRTINRKYLALVWGNFTENEGTITGHIGRNLKNRKIMHVFPTGEYGKHAVTHYKVLEHFDYVTLLECKLETGRTHQIRAHMSYIKHPLFNDDEYGGNQILKGTTFTKYKQFVENCFQICPRQALHAKSLEFEHPITGETLFFDSELPNDMASLIEKWRNYIHFRKTEQD
jgi:23S rRNA pseudouridine1911/1915/1917 synthase